MDEKILTVTVPSYNVQAYLEDCLESFVNSEVMDDIEVLIVNEGSSDDTATIAERYVSKYENTFLLPLLVTSTMSASAVMSIAFL